MCRVKTDNKDFKFFIKECNKWKERYGLGDWEVEYLHTDLDDAEADCCWNSEQRHATIRLNKEITVVSSSKRSEIANSAHHEICEVMLARIRTLCNQNHVLAGEIGSEVHAIINRLARNNEKRL